MVLFLWLLIKTQKAWLRTRLWLLDRERRSLLRKMNE